MGARDHELKLGLEMIRSGVSFDVIGGRGTGRSHFLTAVERELLNEGWTVLLVRGIASLRQNSLTALHMAGFGTPTEPRPPSTLMVLARDALTGAIRPGSTVALIDDWDDLDEASWGMIEYVRRTGTLPTVVSRLQGLPARHTPSGLPASTLESTFAIDLTPMSHVEIKEILEEHLGGPVAPEISSTVFERSSGIVGLAIDMATAAAREGRVVKRDGQWVQLRDLWSPSMRTVLEAHLESLTAEERDALQTIALMGSAKLSTVLQVVPWPVLEHLEERSLIRVFDGDQRRVVVQPPMLLDYFQHEPLVTRRERLTQRLLQELDIDESHLKRPLNTGSVSVNDETALFLTVVQDHTSRLVAVAEAEFRSAPTAATALTLIQALQAVAAPTASIQDVFDDAPIANGRFHDIDVVRLEVARAYWLAYRLHDRAAAHKVLGAVRAAGTPESRLADAAAVQIDSFLARIPEDFAERLRVTDDLPGAVTVLIALPSTVAARLVETKMAMFLARGELDATTDRFDLLDELDKADAGFVPDVLVGLVDLALGKFDEAMAFARRRYEEAVAALDVPAVRGFAGLLTTGLTMQGDYGAVEDILNTALALVPTQDPGIDQVTLLVNGAIAAIRSGRPDVALRYERELDSLDAPNGVLPGQHRAWAKAQQQVFDYSADTAAETLRAAGDELWDRGGLFVAAHFYLTAQEVDPDPSRLVEDLRRARQVEGRLIGVHADYIEALHARDGLRLRALAGELVTVGRPGYAIAALHHALEWANEDGDAGDADAIDARLNQLISTLPAPITDTSDFMITSVQLSDKERHLLDALGQGLSNWEIATNDALSVRTIEGQILRLSQKLAVKGRGGLIDWARVRAL